MSTLFFTAIYNNDTAVTHAYKFAVSYVAKWHYATWGRVFHIYGRTATRLSG